MQRIGSVAVGALVVTLGIVSSSNARAASLQKVDGWRQGDLPADISMYVYVPDKVVAHPPVLTLVHYCGGDAGAVFGQAKGIANAADQYGFVMVVPSSGRCWDIVSNKTRTRDGGGDSHAIKLMVTYALQHYQGNAERVYSTGDSSGGMMTELLLALYPDIFKAGAAFAGMPAGCRGSNESGSGGGYSYACAGGTVSHTPQEWGDIVRMMNPGYTGHRPRVQLFHGDNDTTIKYPNHTEAIKEWSNVLGLMANPTTTDMNVPLGDHQATRQRWKNECGYVTLDAFTSLGGDHGPSDALFKAEYVVPFLGLDKTGPLDPEVEQCQPSGGSGGVGAGGSAGSPASGGAGTSSGGSNTGGAGSSSGGTGGSGGASTSAGNAGSPATGGMSVAGSALYDPIGGTASTPGGTASGAVPGADEPGCSCRVVAPGSLHLGRTLLALALAGLAFARRRRG